MISRQGKKTREKTPVIHYRGGFSTRALFDEIDVTRPFAVKRVIAGFSTHFPEHPNDRNQQILHPENNRRKCLLNSFVKQL